MSIKHCSQLNTWVQKVLKEINARASNQENTVHSFGYFWLSAHFYQVHFIVRCSFLTVELQVYAPNNAKLQYMKMCLLLERTKSYV